MDKAVEDALAVTQKGERGTARVLTPPLGLPTEPFLLEYATETVVLYRTDYVSYIVIVLKTKRIHMDTVNHKCHQFDEYSELNKCPAYLM